MSESLREKSRELLRKSIISYKREPAGTVAARDAHLVTKNYDQVFTRDFVISAAAFLLDGETDIVKNFLTCSLELQSRDKHMNCYSPGDGLLPASFRIETDGNGNESLIADFGEKAIARVAPIDAPFWWLYLLRIYTKVTGDTELARSPDFQKGIRLILGQVLPPRFDMFPTLLVPDGSFMIDRRLGVYGHPIDIQALFYIGLRSAMELLSSEEEENLSYIHAAEKRARHLLFHIRNYYWIDIDKLNEINRFHLEDYGEASINQFNINPNAIPPWTIDWLAEDGGYLAGNLGPGRMDFRFFSGGNLLAVMGSLINPDQSDQLFHLIEHRQDDLLGTMPMKVSYPALEGLAWELLTGSDVKNSPWSYQNGGGWPFLLWMFTVSAMKAGRQPFAEEQLSRAWPRLAEDEWPEYYDGKNSRLIGKEARLYQTWSIAGCLAADALLRNPEKLSVFLFPDDLEPGIGAAGESC